MVSHAFILAGNLNHINLVSLSLIVLTPFGFILFYTFFFLRILKPNCLCLSLSVGDDETFQDIVRDFSNMASHDPEQLSRRCFSTQDGSQEEPRDGKTPEKS